MNEHISDSNTENGITHCYSTESVICVAVEGNLLLPLFLRKLTQEKYVY